MWCPVVYRRCISHCYYVTYFRCVVVTHCRLTQFGCVTSGDQVVEWNGQPLSGESFERVLSVVNGTPTDTLHLFTLPRILVGWGSFSHRGQRLRWRRQWWWRWLWWRNIHNDNDKNGTAMIGPLTIGWQWWLGDGRAVSMTTLMAAVFQWWW